MYSYQKGVYTHAGMHTNTLTLTHNTPVHTNCIKCVEVAYAEWFISHFEDHMKRSKQNQCNAPTVNILSPASGLLSSLIMNAY